MRIVIPSIRIEAPVIDLGLNPDGTLEVPSRFDEAGWYVGASMPGEAGPAIIAGHVSSRQGPGVFYRLSELRPGDVVKVIRPDGSVARFRVDMVDQFPKAAFPTGRVYGDVEGAALRLITCGGAFDYSTGHFIDNVVVFAHGE
jgi:sortase (surface protein transpeptidase)